jgi:glycosidase
LVGEVPIQLVQGIYPAGAAKSNRYPVGEVTRPKATELAPYLKPLDAVFNFPLAEQLIDAAISERNLAVAATLENAYAIYRKACGCDAIHDAPFLSNHDEIRLMSQFDGNIQHMRMAAAMLMTLPGEPYIYYGEELGMRGKKHPDAGVRTPMRWKRSLHAPGEATWYAKNSKNGAAISVEAERDDPHSLLNYYITLIHWRMAIPALRKGGWSVFPHAQDHLAVWQRTLPGRTVLVVHNLSKEAQTMPLDVPNEPHFTHLLKATHSGATIHGYTLRVPAYTSVVLQ